MFVADEFVEPVGTDYTPPHEYVHTIYPHFEGADIYWLNEAVAQYYGFLLALHAGIGTFSEFLRVLRAERYDDVVLADIDRQTAGYPEYEKGPHVLAALDTEIRHRSDGGATLADVFTRTVSGYDGLVSRVTDVGDDQSLADWLSRFVRTEALPTLSTELSDYVFPGADPAGIRTASEGIGDGFGAVVGVAGIGLGVAERLRRRQRLSIR